MRIETFSRLINRLPSQCQVCHSWPANTVCEDCVSQFAQPHARCQTCALPETYFTVWTNVFERGGLRGEGGGEDGVAPTPGS